MRIICVLLALLMNSGVAAAQSAGNYRLLKIDNQYVKWGEARFGGGAQLTVALIAAPKRFSDARNCRSMAPVDGLLAGSGIAPEEFDAALGDALSVWQAAAGVTFVRTENPDEADILIGMDVDGGGWAHADVLKAASDGEVAPIKRGLVCLSVGRLWKLGFGRDPNAQDLRYTLTHEIGHAIGLNHPSPSGEVMSFRYGEEFADLQPGDIAGVRRLYGPPAPLSVAATGPAMTASR